MATALPRRIYKQTQTNLPSDARCANLVRAGSQNTVIRRRTNSPRIFYYWTRINRILRFQPVSGESPRDNYWLTSLFARETWVLVGAALYCSSLHRRKYRLTKGRLSIGAPGRRSEPVVTWICEKIAQPSGLERTNGVCWTVLHPVFPSPDCASLNRTSMRWLSILTSLQTLWFSPHLQPFGSQDRPLFRRL